MAEPRPSPPRSNHSRPDGMAILDALAHPVILTGEDGTVRFLNRAAEEFLATAATSLIGRRLDGILAADSPVHGLIERARRTGRTFKEHDVVVEIPRLGPRTVSIDVAPLADPAGSVIATFHELAMARKVDRQLTHRDSARSVAAMAAMLAHEVKNPLSGIRGAAQLLERDAKPEDAELTRLIRRETDRIVALIDRMDMFAEDRPIEREAVNVHEVLSHVCGIARTGFAKGQRIVESYDPSLPPVLGHRDRLAQVFLNLLKNAAEAAAPEDGVIRITTAYRPGVLLEIPSGGRRAHLPLVVGIEDNGPGVPVELRHCLFEPFVSGKHGGKGLGLALVAKFVADHGGIVEFESEPGRTRFGVMLPTDSGRSA